MDEFVCDYDYRTVGESITKYNIPDDCPMPNAGADNCWLWLFIKYGKVDIFVDSIANQFPIHG